MSPLKILKTALLEPRKFYWLSRAHLRARALIEKIERDRNSPFSKKPQSGYLRGIDFYERHSLAKALTIALLVFREAHGTFPDLVQPTRFTEKLIWSAFFSEFKIPESGNKLLTSRFIPVELKSRLSCPEILWHSNSPVLPDSIPSGVYYLKASWGSGMHRRVCYPLSEKLRSTLENDMRNWQQNNFSLACGEWWYHCFEKEFLLEEDVCDEEYSLTWMFHVLNGEVHLISIYRKCPFGDESIRLNEDFVPLADQNASVSILKLPEISSDIADRLKEFAVGIGKQFKYARIYFLVGKSGKVFLGEVTFTPNFGRLKWPRYLEVELGGRFKLS
jgi:hypothetical protein